MVNLKAAPPESSAVISFPPSTAQKWILPNGLTVIVQHGAGDYSVYASLNNASVRTGASIRKGDAIGTVGTSDPDLRPHLHFEIRPQGRAVDPESWLRGAR